MPAEAGGVQGFEIQTHHCPACRGTERRFIFVGRKTDFVEGGVTTSTLACAAHEVKVSHHVNGADKTAASRYELRLRNAGFPIGVMVALSCL
jgi:hypothetical protein